MAKEPWYSLNDHVGARQLAGLTVLRRASGRLAGAMTALLPRHWICWQEPARISSSVVGRDPIGRRGLTTMCPVHPKDVAAHLA